MLGALADVAETGVGLGALLAQRLQPGPSGPHVVELTTAPRPAVPRAIAARRSACRSHRRPQSIGGQRARLEPPAALPGALARFDVACQPALGVLETRRQHGAPLDQPRHLDLEVPAQHRHVRTALLEASARLVGRRQTDPRRRPRSASSSGRLSRQRRQLRPVALETLGHGRRVGVRPRPAPDPRARPRTALGSGPPPAPGAGPRARSAWRVVSLASARAAAARARAWSKKLDARSAASAAISASTAAWLARVASAWAPARTTHPDEEKRSPSVLTTVTSGRSSATSTASGPVAAHHHHARAGGGRARPTPPAPGAARGAAAGRHRRTTSSGRGHVGPRGLARPCTRPRRTHRRGGEHGPHHLPFVQRGEHGARRAGALDHDGAQGRAHGRFEGGDPAVVDVDEISEDPEHAGHLAEHLGVGPGALVGHLARQRLGARLEPVTLTLGAAQRVLGVAAGRAPPRRRPRRQLPRPVGPDRGCSAAMASELLGQIGRLGLECLGAGRRSLAAARRRGPAHPARARARSAEARCDRAPWRRPLRRRAGRRDRRTKPRGRRRHWRGRARRRRTSSAWGARASSSCVVASSSAAKRAASASSVDTTSVSADASRARAMERRRSATTPEQPPTALGQSLDRG